ncbi:MULTISPECIES: exonuclease domain-containing protein [Corynebacterium]|uniref:exonuclease domain-containing protein n=2 Tax=Bacteria TaxID=2 RepID=UPI00264CB6E4|nr:MULTISPECIES: exonuclease domain-containing protein [Corynebacterium]MDN8625030.1 exonuclease domain-containing protein [Corynebacterium kroppenstedtii]
MTNSDTDISSPGNGIPADADFSQIHADDETKPTEYIAAIPILGGTAYISESGVTISRTPAAQIYLAPETKIDRDSIRGWSRIDPTPLEPGFIDLFLDATPPTSRGRSQFAPNVLRFSPAHSVNTSSIDFANEALTAMQAGDLDNLRRIARAVSHQTSSQSSSGSAYGKDADNNNATDKSAGDDQAQSTEKKQDDSVSSTDDDAPQSGFPQTVNGALESYPPSFIAFDVETANEANGSICQFGIVVYHEGKETESHTWLCQPPSAWPDFTPATTAIHGINADTVTDEPSCHDRLEQLGALLRKENLPIVAHNAKFDMVALRDAARIEKVDIPHITFACTYLLARALRPGLPNYKLTTVAQSAGSDAFHHHDALADARACGEIMLSLCGMSPHDAKTPSGVQSMADVVESAGYTFGTVHDNSLSLFRKPRRSRPDHQQSSRNAQTRGNHGPTNWESVATPRDIPETNTHADPNGPLFGKNVTLTGEFSPLDKGQLWQAIAQAGGTVGKNVTKKTTLLVCGEWNGKTSKQKRAEELQDKGQTIEIWNQGQLLDALDLN